MDLKAGFKKGELGYIPIDWTETVLSNICNTSSGTTPSRSMQDRYFNNGKHNWVKTLDLNNSEIAHTQEKVTDAALAETSLKNYPVGSVLVAMYGGYNQIGRTGILRVSASVNQAITAVLPNEDKLVPEYLLSCLNYRVGYWKLVASSSRKDPNITKQDVRNFCVALPPLSEQRAIAAALSDVDALLSSLDQLIAKKRDIKQATMQQLLTGKQRLPGFSGKWVERTIREIVANFIDYRGRTPKKLGLEWGNGEIPALSAMNVKMGFIDFSAECYLGSDFLYQKWMTNGGAKKHDLVITMEAPLGNVALIPDTRKYILSQRTVLLQTKESIIENRWLFQFMMSSIFQKTLQDNATGSTASGIQRARFEKLSISIPPIGEQSAIASLLGDLDGEIHFLETKRKKTKLLKHGMMQELLTGKIRLV
jgi:type I restriction enzyme S subunit